MFLEEEKGENRGRVEKNSEVHPPVILRLGRGGKSKIKKGKKKRSRKLLVEHNTWYLYRLNLQSNVGSGLVVAPSSLIVPRFVHPRDSDPFDPFDPIDPIDPIDPTSEMPAEALGNSMCIS